MEDYKSIFTEPMGKESIRLYNEMIEREYRRAKLKSSEDCPEGTKLVGSRNDCKCVDIETGKERYE